MKDHQMHHILQIHTLAPVYVGDGGRIGKKEYFYLPEERKVIVPDLPAMYGEISRKGLSGSFEAFLLSSDGGSAEGRDLYRFLVGQGFTGQDFRRWQRYELDAGDAFIRRGDGAREQKPPAEILTFMKDPYGQPYIPGSTIKGCLRTALLVYELQKDPESFAEDREQIRAEALFPTDKRETNQVLARLTENLELHAFHTRQRRTDRPEGRSCERNFSMTGLRISDSDPLSLSCLTLARKVDYTLNRREVPGPILREAVKPETDIRFSLTIDRELCPYTVEQIFEAVNLWKDIQYQVFYSRFGRGSDDPDTIWIGGGVGYLSKTVTYPMFGKDGVRVTDGIFRQTLDRKHCYREHHHDGDLLRQIAPHVCKCTYFENRLYDMGRAKLQLLQ